GLDDGAVRGGRRRYADRFSERARRRRVTYPRRVVDVVRPEMARDLLCGVVRLVRGSAGRQIDADPLWGRGADPRGDEVERLVPADPAEPGLAAPAEHRKRKSPERAKRRGRAREAVDVGEHGWVERARRVQLQQV